MNFTAEELLLAATVRELAVRSRNEDFQRARLEWLRARSTEPPPPPAVDKHTPLKEILHEQDVAQYREGRAAQLAEAEFKAAWTREHPLRAFVAAALADIEETADWIRDIR